MNTTFNNLKLLAEQLLTKATEALNEATAKLDELLMSVEGNTFDTLEEAEGAIEDMLRGKASDACEGSYCYGLDQYTLKFKAAGELYLATLDVEYNRHDKQYYYVDGCQFKVEKLPE